MRSRGVLDRPVKPGDDSFDCGGRLTKRQFLPRSEATKQSSFVLGVAVDCFASLAMTATAYDAIFGRWIGRPSACSTRSKVSTSTRMLRSRPALNCAKWASRRLIGLLESSDVSE